MQVWRVLGKREPQLWLQAGIARAPLQQGRGLPFPTHEQSYSISAAKLQAGGARVLASPSRGPLGLWGVACPTGGVMAGRVRDGAVGWPELFKQGSALWVRGRCVGEEQRRGVPKASVCPCCLVCQT